jgi:hypothetical protein
MFSIVAKEIVKRINIDDRSVKSKNYTIFDLATVC